MDYSGAQLPDEPQRVANLPPVRPPPGTFRWPRKGCPDHFDAGGGAASPEGIGVAPYHGAKPAAAELLSQIEEDALAAPDPVVAMMNEEDGRWRRA